MARNGSNKINGLTEQAKLFAYAYFNNNGNGTEAAIEAGYSKKSAHVTASRLLNNAKVQELLKKLQSKLEDKSVITKEKVLNEYAKIAFFDLRNLYDDNNALKNIKDLDAIAGAAIAGIKVFEEFAGKGEDRIHIGNTVEVKLNNKIAALDAIRDTLGFKAPTKVANTDGKGNDVPIGTFQVQIVPPKQD